jgi:hypothetical protein
VSGTKRSRPPVRFLKAVIAQAQRRDRSRRRRPFAESADLALARCRRWSRPPDCRESSVAARVTVA